LRSARFIGIKRFIGIVPAPGDYDDGEIGGIMIGKGTEVVGENLPQCRFLHHKSHMLCPDADLGRHGGKPAANRVSYGTACTIVLDSFTQEILIQKAFPFQDCN
jgi:hypothetical protein